MKHYSRAQSQKDSDVARYNRANAYYKLKDYEKAAEFYAPVLKSEDKNLARKSLLNYANALYWSGAGKLERGDPPSAEESFNKAAESYKKILMENPSNLTAKKYLEHTLAKLKEMEKIKNKTQKMPGSSKEKEEESGKRDEEYEQSGQEEQKKAGEDNEGRKRELTAAKPQQKRPGEMKPDEVKRILEALEHNEEKVQREFRRSNMIERSLEKDW